MSRSMQETRRSMADIVLVNGKVTVDLMKMSACESLAVAGERILAVGSQQDMQTLIDDQTIVLDMGGRRIIPGLIDSHMHPIRAGLTWDDELHWEGMTSLDVALTTIGQKTLQRPSGI